jgi:hypothetical protein
MSQRGTVTQNRAALFEGARAPGGLPAAGRGSSIYDDETAKMMEASNNSAQDELHQKILRLKGVGAVVPGHPAAPCVHLVHVALSPRSGVRWRRCRRA